MSPTESLVDLLERVGEAKKVACVFFEDGDNYDLSILSAMHAEEGNDVVAEVVRVIRSARPNFLVANTVINFCLSEVCRVEVEGQCLYSKTNF